MISYDLIELVNLVKKKSVEITINVTPDNTEINITPWKPFRMACPYRDVKMEDDLK